jgi:hypothetical protein
MLGAGAGVKIFDKLGTEPHQITLQHCLNPLSDKSQRIVIITMRGPTISTVYGHYTVES